MGAAVPIRRKLSSIALITTGVALLVTIVLFLAGEFLASRRSSLQELRILSEAIASNSSAALAFENPDDARSILAAFRSDPAIVAAALYKADGQLFVAYPETVPAGALPAAGVLPGYHFDGATLVAASSVREGDRVLGTLYVRSDMRAIFERLMLYALLAALVTAFAMAAAWIITRRLQRQLSGPILDLAATARLVSDRHDYTVRAKPVGIDELDALTHAFNHMLTHTEHFESRMTAQVNRLGLLQQITHSIGSRHDLNSIFQVVLGNLEEHLPIDFGCICLHDPANNAVTVESIGTKGHAFVDRLGFGAGSMVPIGQNGLYRCMNGALIHEPDTADVPSPFPQRFAVAGLRSLVIAPLAVESSVFGVLVASDRKSTRLNSSHSQ